MSYSTAYAVPGQTGPVWGDDLASTSGWYDWSNFAMARHTQYPECAHLGAFGWGEQFETLESELGAMLHDADADPDITGVTAHLLAGVRARPNEATEIYVTDGEPGEEEETQESIFHEDHGPPPWPGAVFDDASHRWHHPDSGETAPAREHPVEQKARTLAARIKEVPAAVVSRVGTWVAAKYQKLSARYGSTGAKAVLAAMVLLSPTPIPGSSLIPIAVAEAVLRIRKALSREAVAEQLSDEQARQVALELLRELYESEGETFEAAQ